MASQVQDVSQGVGLKLCNTRKTVQQERLHDIRDQSQARHDCRHVDTVRISKSSETANVITASLKLRSLQNRRLRVGLGNAIRPETGVDMADG